MKPAQGLASDQIERRFSAIRKTAKHMRIHPGWIHFVRMALGMSLADLAKASKLAPATVAQMEQREPEGRITIESLRRLADASGCELVYAIVPKTKVSALLKQRALLKAEATIRAADIQMSLEDQRVSVSMKSRIQRLAAQLVRDGKVW
jgi:predicted DNA-binding mobile mystery protein A